jgi:hypothetical protein
MHCLKPFDHNVCDNQVFRPLRYTTVGASICVPSRCDLLVFRQHFDSATSSNSGAAQYAAESKESEMGCLVGWGKRRFAELVSCRERGQNGTVLASRTGERCAVDRRPAEHQARYHRSAVGILFRRLAYWIDIIRHGARSEGTDGSGTIPFLVNRLHPVCIWQRWIVSVSEVCLPRVRYSPLVPRSVCSRSQQIHFP